MSEWSKKQGMRNGLLRLVALVILWALGGSAFAQPLDRVVMNRPRNESRPVRFGISIGLNVMDFRVLNTGAFTPLENGQEVRYFVTTNTMYPGFNVNALMRLRFTDNMHLRVLPGICFGQRDLVFYDDFDPENRGNEATVMKLESSYIEMPILFCYQADHVNNARPYIVAGANVRTDMAAYKKLKIENNQLVRLEKFDLAYEIGFGFEFYFPLFKMAPEVKWSGGLFNTLSNSFAEGAEGYHGAMKSVTPQMVVFSLIFE